MRGWTTGLVVLAVVGLTGGSASAQHLGWCIGVGNKHNTGCVPAVDVPTGEGTSQPPVVTPTQPTGGPDLPGTTSTIVVPPAGETPTLVPYPVPYPVPQPVPQQIPQAVPPQIPQAVPQPMPQPVPPQIPQAVPPQVPPQIPQAVPQPVPPQVPPQIPQAVPQPVPPQVPPTMSPAVPQAVPQVVPVQGGSPGTASTGPTPSLLRPPATQTKPTVIARPVPTGTTAPRGIDPQTEGVSLVETATREPWSLGLVTAQPGRQAHHATPSYRTADGHVVECLAAGFGWRYVMRDDGSVRLAGRLPVLRVTDVIVRDLPANHLVSPECVVAVRRRYPD